MRLRVIVALTAATLGAAAAPALASPTTLTLTGHVEDVFDTYGSVPLTGSIAVGDPVTLSFTYDPATFVAGNFISTPGTEVYEGQAQAGLTLPGFGFDQGAGAATTAYVSNGASYGAGSPPFDAIGFATDEQTVSEAALPFPFPAGSPYYEQELNFTLTDPTATALSDFGFPAQIVPTAFSQASFDLDFNSADGGVIVRADDLQVTTDQVSAAPEPSSWVLILAGVGALGGFLRFARARRREKGASGFVSA